MKSALLRTTSVPVLSPAATAAYSLSSNYKPLHGVFTGHKNSVSSPKISLHFEINNRRNSSGIRRASSESDISQSLHEVSKSYDQFCGVGSRSPSFPPVIPEEESLNQDELDRVSMEDSEFFNSRNCYGDYCGAFVEDASSEESTDHMKIGAYYEQMLKLNPSDALLLRNYGKFLHEVEKDIVRAEECYSRAILTTPGDGELLALYGKLVWETQRDKQRAQCYFDRAIVASSNDWLVIGYYAHFLWQIDDEDEEEEKEAAAAPVVPPPTLVAAY